MSINSKALELFSLEGKVAMITGAASGIGLATAKRLAEMGASIALVDINEPKGKDAAEEIKKGDEFVHEDDHSRCCRTHRSSLGNSQSD